MPNSTTVHRIEVRPRPDAADPKGDAALRDAVALGVTPAPARVACADVYLIEMVAGADDVKRLADELLADAITEDATLGAAVAGGDALVEVHPLPGVMDPAGEAIELAIQAMLGVSARVRTGRRFDFFGTDRETARVITQRTFANTVIHHVHDGAYQPEAFPHAAVHPPAVIEIPLDGLDDDALASLSRDKHLFLDLDEMRTIQAEFARLGRAPREIELESLAQTWSEHCVHKTFRATIRYDGPLPDAAQRPGHTVGADGTITIENLLKSTVAAATHELIAEGIDWCLSVFVDNAGIIAFDRDHAVCFKVETHNHPSAIEPYGGAATGIGGCIRDIIGTGLAAKPIAATDVFCVASGGAFAPNGERALPAGCLHPSRILHQVVAGVRDYGNRMGIPTLNGTVWFDDDYVGNPLVYCGCVGIMPRGLVQGEAEAGDRIIAIGGRTGRDGIHGATFSSAELTDVHAVEFGHAVQIGNAVTEKKMLDAILEARGDGSLPPLFRSITDCGAGGFSSAVGEMGEHLGAEVSLENAPLKYDGLTPTEIWISEAQERMVLAVPQENVPALQAICDRHDAELCDLGVFGTPGAELILRLEGAEYGRLSMAFLHDGRPQTVRVASAKRVPTPPQDEPSDPPSLDAALLALLAHPNIASKEWIVRQYDHEVQGHTVIKPLVGPAGHGPGDAAVVQPVVGSSRGLAIANGLATGLRDDPYVMAIAAVDECVRNLVCVGADPSRIAILDNFCWPSCDDPERLGALVQAAAGCYDAAKAYRTPFVSGKDSLNNQFRTEGGETIAIPPTLLISGFGIVPDLQRCVTMDAKSAGNVLVLVGTTTDAMGGSHYRRLFGGGSGALPEIDLALTPRVATAVHAAISKAIVRSAHDASEGGLLVAAAEMAIASGLGLALDFSTLTLADVPSAFAETPGRYLLEVRPASLEALTEVLGDVPHVVVGMFNDSARLTLEGRDLDIPVDRLLETWLTHSGANS